VNLRDVGRKTQIEIDEKTRIKDVKRVSCRLDICSAVLNLIDSYIVLI